MWHLIKNIRWHGVEDINNRPKEPGLIRGMHKNERVVTTHIDSPKEIPRSGDNSLLRMETGGRAINPLVPGAGGDPLRIFFFGEDTSADPL